MIQTFVLLLLIKCNLKDTVGRTQKFTIASILVLMRTHSERPKIGMLPIRALHSRQLSEISKF